MVKVTWILPALSIFTYFFSGSLCFRFDFKKGPSKLQAKSLLLPPVARISETSIASTRKEFIKYSHLNTFFKSALNIFDGKDYKSLGKIFTFDFVRDVIVIGLLSYSIKKILLFFYNMEKLLFQRMGEGMGSLVPDYENSIFGYIDAPLTRAFKLLFPLIYAVDLLSPVLSFFGIASEATKGYFDVCVFGTLCYFLGSLLTRVKDWIASKRRLLMVNLNPELVIDKEAARLTDDITSGLIWTAIIIYGLQSLKLSNRVWSGFLTVGGLGGYSIANALRPIGENLFSGIVLRLQDKFRVGETIATRGSKGFQLEGVVNAISRLDTELRKDDNSITTVPHKVFLDSEVVNWSRTKHRQFKTKIELPNRILSKLPDILSDIKSRVRACPSVDSDFRQVVVSATGFNKDTIVIAIEVNVAVNEKDPSAYEAQNEVVQAIAQSMSLALA